MSNKPTLALLTSLSLLLPLASLNAFAAFEADTRSPSEISLDKIEQCLNTMQCNAQLFTGETVSFTGTLVDADGTPIGDREVKIVALVPTPAIIELTTTTTDLIGTFTAEWTVQLLKEESATYDVTRQFQTETLEIFAMFEGDDEFAPSKSSKLSASVTVNSILTTMNSDKTLYNEGDSVLIFVAFIDSNDNFVDPDTINATWNNQPIELEKKKEGSYTFTIQNIEKRHQQIIIVPQKEGYNLSTAYLTIIVSGLR